MFEYRYKPPFYLRRWFQATALLFFVLGIAGIIGISIFLKPYKLRAGEFDFADIDKLERASIIYDRDGLELGRIFVLNRDPIELEKVPLHMIHSLIAIEDARFFEHDGVDYMGIARAMFRNVRAGSAKQGASTITQQLARNAFSLTEKSYDRKLVEAFLAHRIEKNFSKAEIMEMYLNRIYFGSGFYGVNAAAKGYFGKEISEISQEEAATLCGLIKSPGRLSPINNIEASKRARDYVFVRMVEERMITKAESEVLKAKPIVLAPKRVERKRSFEYAYEQVRQQVMAQIGFEAASEGGFHIYTTIDSKLQLAASQSLVKHLDRVEKLHIERTDEKDRQQTYAEFERVIDSWNKELGDRPEPAEGEEDDFEDSRPLPEYLQGAALAIDNRTGAVRALVGGREFTHSAFDRTLLARRKVGTSFTPFVYAAGFAGGKFSGSKVDDSPLDNKYVQIGGETGIVPEYGAETSTPKYEKWIPARHALISGKNAATVRFGIEAGLENVVKTAQEAGIIFEGEIQNYNSTFLGNSEASVAEMALAYTIFPNAGKRPVDIFIIEQIRDNDGNKIFGAESEEPHVRVIDPYSAWQVHSALAESLETGTASLARSEYGLGQFPVAAKTGTAYSFKDDWVIGYTSEVTCAVWTGFDKASPIYDGAFSSETILPVWTEIINESAEIFPPQPIQPPADAIRVEVCSIAGDLATEFCYHYLGEEVEGETNANREQVRDSFVEFLDPKRPFKRMCAAHGPGGRLNPLVIQPIRPRQLIDPRFAPTRPVLRPDDFDLDVQPVFLQSQTIEGADPYNSVKLTSIRPRILGRPVRLNLRDIPFVGPPAPPAITPSATVERPDPNAPRFTPEPIRPSLIEPTVPDYPSDPNDDAPIFRRPGTPDPTPASQPELSPDPDGNRYGAPATPRPPRRTEDGVPSILDEDPDSAPVEPPRAERIQFD
ncbi:MAG: membrane carboxypeptidase/penicillin-binding protein [Verrucomicrobiales bacterium]|jgi:membrane carboxypeptidase/penicillin-binding protein